MFTILVLYQIKHFLCDYPLQTDYMLGKFKEHPHYIKPLAAHAGVHALFTLVLVAFYNLKLAVPMAILDFVSHFIIDRVKAHPTGLGKYQSITKKEVGQYQTKVKYLHDMHNTKRITSDQYVNELTKHTQAHEQAFKDNKYFWLSLGADQMLHNLVHILIVWMVVS